jgi:predicted nuclease with RNAse H fold
VKCAGVDVGGRRKGFHGVVIDGRAIVAGPERLRSADEATAWLAANGAQLVAVDSPIAPAPRGRASRVSERELRQAVCGIRYTPDRAGLDVNPVYYEWIDNGLELYAALAAAGLASVECFPTASWTRWFGTRGLDSRARWTSRSLGSLSLAGVPARLNQDARDAVCAALTARAVSRGEVDWFGPIAVPREAVSQGLSLGQA